MAKKWQPLALTIEIPDFNTEGMREAAELWAADTNESVEEAFLDDFTINVARERVHVVLCGVPGVKCLNSEFEVHVMEGRIVGVNVAPAEEPAHE